MSILPRRISPEDMMQSRQSVNLRLTAVFMFLRVMCVELRYLAMSRDLRDTSTWKDISEAMQVRQLVI